MKNIQKSFNKSLFIFVSLFMTFSHQVLAEQYWQVLGNTAWVSGDDRLSLDMPSVKHADLRISSNTEGDLQWITMHVPYKFGGTIKSIILCYQVSSEDSYISQIRLSEYLIPPKALVKHDDGTDLTNTEGTCYISNVDDFKPAGSVNLSLRLNFTNTDDIIHLGALGVLVDQ